jgi:hypothetical protein
MTVTMGRAGSVLPSPPETAPWRLPPPTRHLIFYVVLPLFIPILRRAAKLEVESVGILVDQVLYRFVVVREGLSPLVETEKVSTFLDRFEDMMLRVQ